ncbi:MAG: hypothetical protein K2Q10_12695, partial [Rhodospirillales bacterium]|nr:hypothetical protein [Rhodospirillales bacterium]
AGALAVSHKGAFAGLAYDAVLHAVFVGFVFSMVFGHAPIILPAVLRVSVPFRPAFYLPLALLHLSLTLRIAGDLGDFGEARLWGALLNGVAVALFILGTAATALRANRGRRAVPAA